MTAQAPPCKANPDPCSQSMVPMVLRGQLAWDLRCEARRDLLVAHTRPGITLGLSSSSTPIASVGIAEPPSTRVLRGAAAALTAAVTHMLGSAAVPRQLRRGGNTVRQTRRRLPRCQARRAHCRALDHSIAAEQRLACPMTRLPTLLIAASSAPGLARSRTSPALWLQPTATSDPASTVGFWRPRAGGCYCAH